MTKHRDKKATIEINGRVYDPRTGVEIGGNTVIKPRGQKTSIDGFMGNKSARIRPAPTPAPHSPKPAREHPGPKQTKRQVARSQTLLRSVVSKPEAKETRAHESPTSPLHQHSLRRQKIAQTTPKSRHINKFNDSYATSAVPTTSRHLPVAEQQKRPAQHLSAKTKAVASDNRHTTIKDFEQAIQNATSHLEAMPKKSKRKLKATKARVALVSASAVLLFGFFAWQNTPNLQMRLAASRANIPASLPAYSPAGFGIDGNVQTEPGKVTVSFQSRTDDKAFRIIQQASDWNTQALYANYVLPSPQSSQIYTDDNKTIYLFESSGATWVDNGIWYRIEGTAELTSEQLQRIASSL
jgi:hypothetical protein